MDGRTEIVFAEKSLEVEANSIPVCWACISRGLNFVGLTTVFPQIPLSFLSPRSPTVRFFN